jgi:hypothetical protein
MQQKRLQQGEALSVTIAEHEANKNELRRGRPNKADESVPTPPLKGTFFERIKKWFLRKLFGVVKAPETVQETLPIKAMYKDGICKVSETHYNKTIIFGDLNYQLARKEDQQLIFALYSELLNSFDPAISVQLSFVNKYGYAQDFKQQIEIPEQQDKFNAVRKEYADMLKDQIAKGNNGLVKFKYITFGIDAKNIKEAKPKLERIELSILNGFRTLGVFACSLSGAERIEALHDQLHPNGKAKLDWDWNEIPINAKNALDAICPAHFEFEEQRVFKMGDTFSAITFLQVPNSCAEFSDKMLNEFLNMDNAISVSVHLRSMEQQEAIKNTKRKITDIDAMKIDAQKRAFNQGYDPDLLSTNHGTAGAAAKELLKELQSRNERMFRVTFLLKFTAPTKQKLDNIIFAAQSIAQKHNCAIKRLDFMQERGLISCLTLGANQLASEIKRGLTTSSTAVHVPFQTCELFQDGKALYYGLNSLSNNIIMADRSQLSNPNGLILGIPGSGKSFAAKREIVNAFLITHDDIIITDPEGEYYPLVKRLGGQVVNLSANSTHYINPLDINLNIDDDVDPLKFKAEFIYSMFEILAGGHGGLTGREISIIDRCVQRVYRKYIKDPRPENMPILQDMYDILREQEGEEAQNLATALEVYVTGSMNLFNNRTNVNLSNRLVCFDIKQLGNKLKKLSMLILMDCVWQRVTKNRAEKKKTWFYVDEFHLLLKEPQTAAYSVEIWKRFRKWGGVPTAITQNVKDFLPSAKSAQWETVVVENILDNTPFILMLNQSPGDRDKLAEMLKISEYQISYVSGSGPGEGLLFFGNVIIPFRDKFPKNTELYKIMTTKPDEVA